MTLWIVSMAGHVLLMIYACCTVLLTHCILNPVLPRCCVLLHCAAAARPCTALLVYLLSLSSSSVKHVLPSNRTAVLQLLIRNMYCPLIVLLYCSCSSTKCTALQFYCCTAASHPHHVLSSNRTAALQLLIRNLDTGEVILLEEEDEEEEEVRGGGGVAAQRRGAHESRQFWLPFPRGRKHKCVEVISMRFYCSRFG